MKRFLIFIIICLTCIIMFPCAIVHGAWTIARYTDDNSLVHHLESNREMNIEIVIPYGDKVGFAGVCCYDKNGKLVKMYSEVSETGDLSDFEEKFTFSEDVYMVKVMAWNSFENMNPLMETQVIYKAMDYQKPSGEGTEESPYLVTTAKELAYIFIENDKNYKLMNNIDLSMIKWIPNEFRGVFDGQGYSITGINVADSIQSSGFVSLLMPQTISTPGEWPGGYYIASYIKNLNIEITDSGKGAKYSGGIAGEVRSVCSYIENCNVRGDITSSCLAGGIVGYNQAGSIENCNSKANVTVRGGSKSYAGGIAGYSGFYVNSEYSDIINCESSGTVKVYSNAENYNDDEVLAGGIVGYDEGLIKNCKTTAKLYSDGKTGGIAGYICEPNASNRSEIVDCVDESIIITE